MLLGGGALLFLTALLCVFIGPGDLTLPRVIEALGGRGDLITRTILFKLRLPRLALATSVGAALAASGVVFQALLRNPLAEPYILGVSNGCAVGAVLGYLVGAGPIGLLLLAFGGGAIVVFMVLFISRNTFGTESASMLLAGSMVGAISAAILFMLLHFLGLQVQSAIQWMLGDFSSASPATGYGSLLLFAVLLAVSLLAGGALNALSLGDEEALSLGVNVRMARRLFYLGTSFVIGLSVSFCGAIGFVGLVVPHILRRVIGPDHRALLPASVLGGGIFVLLCDTFARSFLASVDNVGGELPIGAVTALVGAPIYIVLLRRGMRE
jgi:iron complex transport system permease protein